MMLHVKNLHMDLKEYIKVYDEVLDPNVCRNAIELFNKDNSVVRLEKPQMSSLNMTIRSEKDKDHDWSVVQSESIMAIRACAQQYAMEVKVDKLWPIENSLEQIKMHKYSAEEGDSFPKHIDVGNYESARRFASFVIFLNDTDDGVYFDTLDYKVTAQTGRMMMFPSTWQYPYADLPPTTDDKYTITTYLHYV